MFRALNNRCERKSVKKRARTHAVKSLLKSVKCSENGTAVARAAVTEGNPKRICRRIWRAGSMPEKLTNKCPKISNGYMFRGMNRHEGHLRHQQRDVSKVREFTKIYTPPLMRTKSLIRAMTTR